MNELRINGNDLELDGQKVARLFDVVGTLRVQLEEAIERANEVEDDSFPRKYQQAYRDGWQDGYNKGMKGNSNE